MEELPFDKLEVKHNGAWKATPVEEWLKTDCAHRVEQIMAGDVQFTKGGSRVMTTTALAAIKKRG